MPIQVTTNLPNAQPPTLGNGVEDEIAVDIPDDTNNGDYRVQTRETGASSWSSSAPGWDEQVLASDGDTSGQVSTIVINREDGEEYEVRVRTETPDATGAWTSPVSIVTKFPGASNLTLSVTGTSSIDLSWQDNADNEDGFKVERRDELDPARPTGYTSWTTIADLAANTTTYSDSGLDPNHSYEYRIRAYTEHTTALSGSTEATTDVSYPSGWLLELRREDGEILTIDGGDLITESIQYRRKPSAISSWDAEIPRTPVIDDWLDSEAYWWYNGSLILRGPWHRDEGYETLSGKGWLWGLKQGGTSRRFQSVEGWKAARDYIDQETPYTAVATQPTANVIDQDKVVQDADTTTELSNLFTPAASDPYRAESGRLVPQQTCFTQESDQFTADSGTLAYDNPDYSGGFARGIGGSGDYLEYTFTVDYTIPAADVGVHIRHGASSDTPGVTFTLNGSSWTPTIVGSSLALTWDDMANDPFGNGESYAGGDLTPGTYTLRMEVTTAATTDFLVDVVAPADNRYSYTFDNNNGGTSGYLDGPQYYPNNLTIQSGVHDDTYNIHSATLTTSISDTTGGQRLQVSNDGGANWYPQDGTETNTQSIDVTDFPTVGTDIKGRVTLDRYGSRTTATPQTGFNVQTLDSWTLDITTNSLGVIDDRTYTGNHFENLKAICDDAGVVFVGRMQDGMDEIEVFALGDKSATLDVDDPDVLDHNRVVDREDYANVQTVAGEKPDGTLIEATAESATEISKHGRVEGPYEVEKRLSTKSDVENQAAQLLAQRIASRDVTGWMDLVPEYAAQVTPGYEYQVTYGDFADQAYGSEQYGDTGYGGPGDLLILRGLTYNDLRKDSLDFEDSRDVAAVLSGLGGELKQTKDAI